MDLAECMHLIAKSRRLTDRCSPEETFEICWMQHLLNVGQFEDALHHFRQYDVIAVHAQNRCKQFIIVRPHLVIVSHMRDNAEEMYVEKISAHPLKVLCVDYGFDCTFEVMRVPGCTHVWNSNERHDCRRYVLRGRLLN